MKKLLGFLFAMIFSVSAFASGSVQLNGKLIKNREELHTVIAKGLNFPSYYGKNLDALYDILVSDFSGETIIKIKHLNFLRQRLGNTYTQAFLEVIGEASETNPRVILVLE